MGPRHRLVLACCAIFSLAFVLASCSDSSAPRSAPAKSTSGTTTSTTLPPTTVPPTTVPPQGVGVPNVVNMKIDLARFYLQTAGFTRVPLNAPCNKGTLASQSVVASLAIPGKPPDVNVGAQPLAPGTLLPKGSRVGITWSGCYPAGTTVPAVTGLTFVATLQLLHLAGLHWACYSVGGTPTSTTTTKTAPPPSTATPRPPPSFVLMQGTPPGTVVHAGSVVALFLHHCPQ